MAEIAEEPTDDSAAKAWLLIFQLANVPATGPNNREERRRVERVLAKLKKRGLTVN